MLRMIVVILVVLALVPTVAAASSGCMSMSEARRVWPDDHLRYRLEGRRAGGRKCWYAPGAPVYAPEANDRVAKPVELPRWREVVRESEPSRRVSDVFDRIAFFLPQPAAVEPVEEEIEPVKAKPKRKATRVAQAAPKKPSVDEQIKYLCGDLNHGFCNEEFREWHREQRRREGR